MVEELWRQNAEMETMERELDRMGKGGAQKRPNQNWQFFYHCERKYK